MGKYNANCFATVYREGRGMIVRIALWVLSAVFVFWPEHGIRAQERLKVFVSILPRKYFVEQIGKGRVDVGVMVEPGASPHTYEPKPSQMASLAGCKIYFAIGVTFERVWLPKISASNPTMKVVSTQDGIERIPMKAHHHDDPKKEEAGGPDPHIWLSPPLVLLQARSILAALQATSPSDHDFFEANYRVFASSIMDLDAGLRSIFRGKRGMSFMVFHPAWGYFAKAYGLSQIPIEAEGKEPKPAKVQELITRAKKSGIKVIFVQPQVSSRSAEQMAKEIGAEVVTADPLAEDWGENLRKVSEKFAQALK